ncbi:hypothetical protein HYH03_000431 [Edaphochlamys debaryana]|uniref:Protein kinase domain-containing protein n=1 Tax=Edaphochlamys debaryana TaxID=47281 RepID=A0A835YFU2_9CHLO|nr:hypothetical protein HYH03_000431 [Edaphochlamys debaryana]|eukprot:KAG2501933.1 hypothetical protein HYH03_000431 [Edaphochlamys debaryana]
MATLVNVSALLVFACVLFALTLILSAAAFGLFVAYLALQRLASRLRWSVCKVVRTHHGDQQPWGWRCPLAGDGVARTVPCADKAQRVTPRVPLPPPSVSSLDDCSPCGSARTSSAGSEEPCDRLGGGSTHSLFLSLLSSTDLSSPDDGHEGSCPDFMTEHEFMTEAEAFQILPCTSPMISPAAIPVPVPVAIPVPIPVPAAIPVPIPAAIPVPVPVSSATPLPCASAASDLCRTVAADAYVQLQSIPLPPGVTEPPVPLALCLQLEASAAFYPAPGAPELGGPVPGDPCFEPFCPNRATVQRGWYAYQCEDQVLMVDAACKRTTLCIGAPTAEATDMQAQQAATALSHELSAHVVRDSALSALGGALAAELCALPLLAWTVREHPSRPDCLDLLLLTPWADGGDLHALTCNATSAAAAGVCPSLDLAALSAAPSAGPLVAWRPLLDALVCSAWLLGALEGARLLYLDLKAQNLVWHQGRTKLIDPVGSRAVPPVRIGGAELDALVAAGALSFEQALQLQRLAPVSNPGGFVTKAFAPPEACLEEAREIAAGLLAGNCGCFVRWAAARLGCPGLWAAVLQVLTQGGGCELAALNGGADCMCLASHVFAWAASLQRALAGARAGLAARVAAGGWPGAGPVNEGVLGELEVVCAACMTALPSQRPSPQQVEGWLADIVARHGL